MRARVDEPRDGRTYSAAALLVSGLLTCTGCAALTESQVSAVHDFAAASKRYVALPPRVIIAYGDVRALRSVLDVSGQSYSSAETGKRAAQKLVRAASDELTTDAAADELGSLLSILDSYAELLDKLSSDDFVNALNKPAEETGKTVDKAVADYNATFGKSLSPFGSSVAEAARAVGGLFLKEAQGEAIKTALGKADGSIQSVTARVAALLGPFTSSAAHCQFDVETQSLEDSFESTAQARQWIPVDEVARYGAAIARAAAGKRLADRTLSATRAYGVAHAKLVAIVATKTDVGYLVDEVSALSKEVSAGAQVKADLDAQK